MGIIPIFIKYLRFMHEIKLPSIFFVYCIFSSLISTLLDFSRWYYLCLFNFDQIDLLPTFYSCRTNSYWPKNHGMPKTGIEEDNCRKWYFCTSSFLQIWSWPHKCSCLCAADNPSAESALTVLPVNLIKKWLMSIITYLCVSSLLEMGTFATWN